MSEFNLGDSVVFDGTDKDVFVRAGAVGTVSGEVDDLLVGNVRVDFDMSDNTLEPDEDGGQFPQYVSVSALTLEDKNV